MNYREIIGKARGYCNSSQCETDRIELNGDLPAWKLLKYLETLSPESLKEDKETCESKNAKSDTQKDLSLTDDTQALSSPQEAPVKEIAEAIKLFDTHYFNDPDHTDPHEMYAYDCWQNIKKALSSPVEEKEAVADGYVAIYSKQDINEPSNPDMGYCGTLNTGWQRSFNTSKEGVRNYIFDKYFGCYFDEDSKKDCAALKSLYDDGWKIRPVRLVFTDLKEGK